MGEKPLLSPTGKWMIGGVAGLALLLAALSTQQLFNRPAAQSSADPTTVPSAPATTGKITALGRVEPAGEVIKVGGPSGERIGQLLVKEGQFVNAGQVIARLESYDEQLANKALAESQLRDGLAQLETAQTYGDAQIAEAQTRRSQADTPKLKELAAQEAMIRRLQAELNLAQKDLDRFRELNRSGAVSQKDVDDKQLTYQSKIGELKEAEAQLAKIQQEWRTNRDNMMAQVQTAQADKARSQAQIQIETARSNLQLAQARLERTVIRAPRSGQILKVLKKQGESLDLSSGSGNASGEGIVELGDTRQMEVVAEVYETDIGRVKVGQSATITAAAFPGAIGGTVERIGLKIGKNDVVGTDPAANTDTRVVEVRIRLHNSQPVAGMTYLQVEVAIDPST